MEVGKWNYTTVPYTSYLVHEVLHYWSVIYNINLCIV